MNQFFNWCNDNKLELDPFDIQNRYDLYNKFFYEKIVVENNDDGTLISNQ